MPDASNYNASDERIKQSPLYREFTAEREEILRHKWLESEKAGHDVGFEYALTDWIMKHRANWRKYRTTLQPEHSSLATRSAPSEKSTRLSLAA